MQTHVLTWIELKINMDYETHSLAQLFALIYHFILHSTIHKIVADFVVRIFFYFVLILLEMVALNLNNNWFGNSQWKVSEAESKRSNLITLFLSLSLSLSLTSSLFLYWYIYFYIRPSILSIECTHSTQLWQQ